MAERLIYLSIADTNSDGPSTFSFHVRLDDDVLAANQSLTAEQSRAVRELSTAYARLFAQHGAPQVTRDALAAIGAQLFDLWLAPSWQRIAGRLALGDRRVLVVGSDQPSVLNLPWELLRPAGGEAIGSDTKWSVRRVASADRPLEPAAATLPPGPLRLLYVVSAPTDQAELDFEREEELLLRALGKAGGRAVYDSCDLGSFDELDGRIGTFRPHIVHLTGHGEARDDTGYFLFESDAGKSDPRPAHELAQLFAARGVQCVFVSACEAGTAPSRSAAGGLAQGLVAAGVPLTIGWTAKIGDDVATQFAASFYRSVAAGQDVDRALVAARQAVRKVCEPQGDPSWSLSVLYAGTRQAYLFDTTRNDVQPRPSLELNALPGMVQQGYAQHFIGRRRDVQALLPALRAGELQAVILTGLGGAGKSTLATRLARKLEADGWTPIAVSSIDQTPLSVSLLLDVCSQQFLDAGQRELRDRLNDASLTADERLRSVVAGLNRGRFVLVLDNFESNMDEGSRRILSPELASFYRYALSHMTGGSRLIVTSRYLPADATLPPTAREWQLGEFSEAAFLKFLLRDGAVETRYRKGELPHDLLVRLHRELGGTPRFLAQIRTVLATLPSDELKRELDQVELPNEGAAPGRLQAARDAYCETIFTGRLYGRLSAAAQALVSRAAVFGIAVTAEGLGAVAGMSTADATAASEQACALSLMRCYDSDSRTLWSVYGTLRGWMLSPERLSSEAKRAAHVAAGDFLVELDKQDREGELGVNWLACRLEARAQYLAAGVLDKARDTTGRISGFYLRQGLYGELAQLHDELMQRETHPDTLNWLGAAHMETADYRAARNYFQRAEAAAGDKDAEAAATALHQLATIDVRVGAYTAAREKFGRALTTRQHIGDRVGEAATWHQLASIDLNEGAYSAAREKFERSLTIVQQTNDRAGEGATWHQLATIDVHEGDYPAAREKSDRALKMKQQIGDRAGEAATWHNVATIDLKEGDYPAAREKFGRSLTINQEIGNRSGEAATWHQLAKIDVYEGAPLAAREKFKRALTMRQQIGDRAGEAAAWHELASIELREGAYPAARAKFQQSLKIKQQIGDRVGEAATFYQLGALAAHLGQHEDALRLVGLCFLIDNAIGHADTKSDFNAVATIATQLNLSQEQLNSTLQDVSESYLRDRGATLLRQTGTPLIAIDPARTKQPEPTPPSQPTKSALPGPTDAEYPVWYGTNRRPAAPGTPGAGYSTDRDTVVHRGVCTVFIPKSHLIGSIGSPWWRRLLKMTDDRLRLLSIQAQEADSFWDGVETHLAGLPLSDQTAVVFVHGYNVTFEAAALRAAQIGFDLSIKGTMAFFSWPSRGAYDAYPADEATIEASEDCIADFMTDFALKSGAKSVHIIAHSMGNRGVLRAVNRIAAEAERRSHVKFGQIILAAADVDAELFGKLSSAYCQVATRTTMYVSARDIAVEASQWLHAYPRAGLLPPVTVSTGIDTVNVTNADLTMLGHGYVADARDVLQDMHDLIFHGDPPSKRFGLRELRNENGQAYWLIGA